MPELLVSVRNAAEAESALAGGAALIDIKEPERGALGRADDAAMTAIVRAVAGRRPVSAALGELADGDDQPPTLAGLTFVKWGLAGSTALPWRELLRRRLEKPGPQTVIAAYADWRCAAAPPLEDVVGFACGRPGNVLLIDTHCKDAARLSLRRRPTLLDWLSVTEVIELCRRCRAADVRIALAGSLGPEEMAQLRPANPTWFGVRGAVCAGHDRRASVQADKVRALASGLTPVATPAD